MLKPGYRRSNDKDIYIMPILKNSRHEKFSLNIFKGMSLHDAAIEAGYSPNHIDQAGSRLYRNVKILARIKELNEAAEDDTIASVKERKEVLTEVIRGRFTHFIDIDGNIIELTEENLKSAALQEVRVTQFTGGKDGRAKENTTTIKLHSPIQAIDLLNKMEKIYEIEGTVTIDNRTLNIIVNSEKAKDLTQRLIEGERTE